MSEGETMKRKKDRRRKNRPSRSREVDAESKFEDRCDGRIFDGGTNSFFSHVSGQILISISARLRDRTSLIAVIRHSRSK